ncbi:MAG: sigma-54 dependent transcriptional regulator, partial [Candidatus Eisenbacteria bacterium]
MKPGASVRQSSAGPEDLVPDRAHRIRLLLVEDDGGIRFAMREYLSSAGYDVSEAESCDGALRAVRQSQPDLILLDLVLPDGDALSLLPRLREVAPDLGIVLLTGFGTVDLAVRAIKSGADHFLCKPVQLPELDSILRGLARQRHLERARRAEHVRRDRRPVDPFAGSSAAIKTLARQAARIAESEAPVLITGPTGAGKGVLASWLHAHGTRADEPFVDINCASLSRDFLESELFGHRRGAFTGAVADKPGLLEVAHRGTLFLDEIGDMAIEIQPRLLKVLESGRYRRMGSVDDREADVRLIAATHHDISARAASGEFREDLYFRIQTLPLRVPALSERMEDLPLLAGQMLQTLARDSGWPAARLTPEMTEAMRAYDWPGNLRELSHTVR